MPKDAKSRSRSDVRLRRITAALPAPGPGVPSVPTLGPSRPLQGRARARLSGSATPFRYLKCHFCSETGFVGGPLIVSCPEGGELHSEEIRMRQGRMVNSHADT